MHIFYSEICMVHWKLIVFAKFLGKLSYNAYMYVDGQRGNHSEKGGDDLGTCLNNY